ncbi:unnamed protein product [Gongylonema pulchrum]|uniref:Uncharacterized protein n=1 Tax=Gongylonema pulchrum TaxID=637853 RepID=A0A3P6R679_9BILA|nr:unnamed protein product [Gongylonema pulchrum]
MCSPKRIEKGADEQHSPYSQRADLPRAIEKLGFRYYRPLCRPRTAFKQYKFFEADNQKSYRDQQNRSPRHWLLY